MANKKVTSVKSSTADKATAKKALEIKTPEIKVPDIKAPELKVIEPKAAETKAAGTKAPKKTAVNKAPKKEIKVKAVVEYYGKQVEEKEIIARVKKAWTKSGKKVGDIKSMELYIKPEEAAVYYVINGTATGAVEF